MGRKLSRETQGEGCDESAKHGTKNPTANLKKKCFCLSFASGALRILEDRLTCKWGWVQLAQIVKQQEQESSQCICDRINKNEELQYNRLGWSTLHCIRAILTLVFFTTTQKPTGKGSWLGNFHTWPLHTPDRSPPIDSRKTAPQLLISNPVLGLEALYATTRPIEAHCCTAI